MCRADPWADPAVNAAWEPLAAAHHLTASAFDDRTGCWYHYRPGIRVTTASVLKAEILAGVELRAQGEGRGLTPAEVAQVAPMIRVSDNASASRLFSSLGGAGGLSRVGDAFGLGQTEEIGPVWGLSSTTADDQAGFIERLLQGPGPLDTAHRASVWFFLKSVHPDQRWGVPVGVPAGWDVGLKNGFADSNGTRWRINSVGYVSDPGGGGYSVAILSDGWPSMADGIPVVNAVAARINATLATPPPAPAPAPAPAAG